MVWIIRSGCAGSDVPDYWTCIYFEVNDILSSREKLFKTRLNFIKGGGGENYITTGKALVPRNSNRKGEANTEGRAFAGI